MRNFTVVGLFGVSLLAACGDLNVEPAISSFNEASVAIQLDGNSMDLSNAEARTAAIAKADILASDTCRRGPRRTAEFASTRNIQTGQYSYAIERLYLCLR